MTHRQLLMCYYGYAFESYCTSPTPKRASMTPEQPGDAAGWGGDVNTNVQWCSVVKSKLGDIRLVIGGEVDCVRGLPVIIEIDEQKKPDGFLEKYTGQPDTFVELKTSQAIRSPQDAVRFEKWAFDLNFTHKAHTDGTRGFQETAQVLFPVVFARSSGKAFPNVSRMV